MAGSSFSDRLYQAEFHVPERRLLSFILLLPCLGLSRFPLQSSELHESWGSSVPGIWNAENTELMGEAGLQSPPRSYLEAQGTGIRCRMRNKGQSTALRMEPCSLMLASASSACPSPHRTREVSKFIGFFHFLRKLVGRGHLCGHKATPAAQVSWLVS